MEHTGTLAETVLQHPIYKAIHAPGGYVASTVGASMHPMLRERRDTVHLLPAPDSLRRGDLPLYMRLDGTLVLHRVLDVRPEGYTMCGDGQTACEYFVPHAAVLGVTKGFWRDETYILCTAKRYRLYVWCWCLSLRLRRCLLWLIRPPKK